MDLGDHSSHTVGRRKSGIHLVDKWVGVGLTCSLSTAGKEGGGRTGKRNCMSLKVGWFRWVWVNGCLGHSSRVEHQDQSKMLVARALCAVLPGEH